MTDELSKWQNSEDKIQKPPAFRLTRQDGSIELTFRIFGHGELIVVISADGPLISIKKD